MRSIGADPTDGSGKMEDHVRPVGAVEADDVCLVPQVVVVAAWHHDVPAPSLAERVDDVSSEESAAPGYNHSFIGPEFHLSPRSQRCVLSSLLSVLQRVRHDRRESPLAYWFSDAPGIAIPIPIYFFLFK